MENRVHRNGKPMMHCKPRHAFRKADGETNVRGGEAMMLLSMVPMDAHSDNGDS